MKEKIRCQSEERNFFNLMAKERGDTWWGNTTIAGKKRLERKSLILLKMLSRYTAPAILELGCGTGTFSQYIFGKYPFSLLTACDISIECVKVANRQDNHNSAYFAVADAALLPCGNDTFDVVIGNAILHHLPLETSLEECYRVLKPSGIIIFFEPNMMNPQVALEKNVRSIGEMLQNTEDETAFLRWSLSKTLQKIGFSHIVIQPFDFLHPATPGFMIRTVDGFGRLFEKIPVLREISGSLLIMAERHAIR